MRTLSYKQRLALAVNTIPKAATYPYGKLRCLQSGNKKSRLAMAIRKLQHYCRLDVKYTESLEYIFR